MDFKCYHFQKYTLNEAIGKLNVYAITHYMPKLVFSKEKG